VELLLNLVWLAISTAALLAWVSWRKTSSSELAPKMMCGTMVVVCVLVLLFPVISISDDLSQSLSLAEGTRIQDILKAPELRGIYHLAAILPSLLWRPRCESCTVTRSFTAEAPVVLHEIFWYPAIEKRPPPAD